MIKKRFFLLFGLLFLFFLDGQLSFWFSSLMAFRFFVSSQLLLICLFFLSLLSRGPLTYLGLACLGLFYDSHYFLHLGLTSFLFPMVFFLLAISRATLLRWIWGRVMTLLCLLWLFPVALYGFGLIYGLTNYPVHDFLYHQLLPTGLLNSLYLLIGYRYLDKTLIIPLVSSNINGTVI